VSQRVVPMVPSADLQPDVNAFTAFLRTQPAWHEIPENRARIQRDRWRFALTATADELRRRWRDHTWETVQMYRFAIDELGTEAFTMQDASDLSSMPRDPDRQVIQWLEDEVIV
jgi:hypothetical protein